MCFPDYVFYNAINIPCMIVLLSIQLLLQEPNLDHPLMPDVAKQYKVVLISFFYYVYYDVRNFLISVSNPSTMTSFFDLIL